MLDFNLKKVLIVITFVWFLWEVALDLLNLILQVVFRWTFN